MPACRWCWTRSCSAWRWCTLNTLFTLIIIRMLFGAALQVVADSELFHSALVHLRAALNITEKVRL